MNPKQEFLNDYIGSSHDLASQLPEPSPTKTKAAKWAELLLHMQGNWDRPNLYRANQFSRMVYTQGVRHFADTLEAHWLIDLIASHQPEIARKHTEAIDFQVWTVTHSQTHPNGWFVAAWSDVPEESAMIAHQEVEFSDLPREIKPLKFYVENNTLLFPAEH
jgi:hypothetical protein